MLRTLVMTLVLSVSGAAQAADSVPAAQSASDAKAIEQQNRLREAENAKLKARVKELEDLAKQKEAESQKKSQQIEELAKQAKAPKPR